MHGDQLGAVGEGRLHLHVMDHLRDTFHHLVAGQHMRAFLYQRRHTLAVARAFDDEIGDEGDGLGMVELDAALEPAARTAAASAFTSMGRADFAM